jgi:hypothetical protein
LPNPSGKPAAPDSKRGTRVEYHACFPSTCAPGWPSVFQVKAFIKTNQWLEYCGSSIAGVKKKRRKNASIGFLNDRTKQAFDRASP